MCDASSMEIIVELELDIKAGHAHRYVILIHANKVSIISNL